MSWGWRPLPKTEFRAPYLKALHSYVVNGFFARDLDAEDWAFIERVRERGCVPSGSLAQLAPTPCTFSDDVIPRVALIEEMDFWQQPYAVDKITVRRSGPVPKPQRQLPGTTPEAIARKERREMLAEARAAEERRAEERRIEQLRRDIEWEKAAPPKLVFGKVDKKRRYIPQWKVDELDAQKRAKIKEAEAQKQRWRAELALKQAAKALKRHEQAANALKPALPAVAIEPTPVDQRAEAQKQRATQALGERMMLVVREARERTAAIEQAARERNAREAQRRYQQEAFDPRKMLFKERIKAVMRERYPQILSLEAVMAATQCDDKQFMIECLEELIAGGMVLKHP